MNKPHWATIGNNTHHLITYGKTTHAQREKLFIEKFQQMDSFAIAQAEAERTRLEGMESKPFAKMEKTG